MHRKQIIFICSSVMVAAIAAILIVELNKEEKIYHKVIFDTNGGTPVSPVEVQHGYKIKSPDTDKYGYDVKNWSDNSGRVWNFDVDVVLDDITLKTSWKPKNYTITYNYVGGTPSGKEITTYTIESNFVLDRPVKSKYVFVGWFDNDGNRIDSITPGRTGNLYLTAKWTNIFVPISEDESRGLINVYASETNPNEYTVSNYPINNRYHLFKGWYDKDGNLLSTNTEYTLTINPNETNYIYSRYMTDKEEEQWNLSHGITPIVSTNSVIYGMYPQSNVSEPAIISKLEQLKPTFFNDYYYYNHEYFVKKTAILARDLETKELLSIRQFDNGNEFVEDEVYWFKVEPLSWNILNVDNGLYDLVSNKLIDVKKYHKNGLERTIDDKIIYSNNYKYSDIREWLNNDFKLSTFAFDSISLTQMEVDNSKGTTATPESGLECENTFDYVKLLSYSEYQTKSEQDRRIKTTDYTRVCGANYSVDKRHLFAGYYWTRSPIETEEHYGALVSRCNKIGVLNNDFVGWDNSCVQPAIQIKIGS